VVTTYQYEDEPLEEEMLSMAVRKPEKNQVALQ